MKKLRKKLLTKAERSAAMKKGWKTRKQKAQEEQLADAKGENLDEQALGALREKFKQYMHSLKHSSGTASIPPEPASAPEDLIFNRAEGRWYRKQPTTTTDNTAPLPNPKTLMGEQKVPVLSVVPPASIIAQGTAMRYGAYLAPRVDGKRGYGPYNWRDQPIEAHIYVDAAIRHLMQWWDGEDHEIIVDDQGRAIDCVSHLAFGLATIGILLDAIANKTLIDDRPPQRRMAASNLLKDHKLARYDK